MSKKKYRAKEAISIHGETIGKQEVVELGEELAERYKTSLKELSGSVNENESGKPQVNLEGLKKLDLKGLGIDQIKDLMEKVRADYPEEKSDDKEYLRKELYKAIHGEEPEDESEDDDSKENQKNIPIRNRNVDVLKEQVENEEVDPKKVLEIEKKNDNRKTLVEFLKEKLGKESEDSEEESEDDKDSEKKESKED